MPTVEYCLANVDAGTRDRLADLECTVERRCLQRCGDCYRSDFLVVDGDVVTGTARDDALAALGVDES